MHSTHDSGRSLQIPIIDISRENAQTGDCLVEAAAHYGFVFIKGQGLGFTSQILDDAFDLVRFEQSLLRRCIF